MTFLSISKKLTPPPIKFFNLPHFLKENTSFPFLGFHLNDDQIWKEMNETLKNAVRIRFLIFLIFPKTTVFSINKFNSS